MPIDTDKFKSFVTAFGFDIDFSDGQFLLTAFKGFADAKKKAYSEAEKKILNQAFLLIKKVADKDNDDFFRDYEQRTKNQILS
jgi:hypothetical protein